MDKSIQIIKKTTKKSAEFGYTKRRKQILLEALYKHRGIVTSACKATGIGASTYYDWIRDDPEFKEKANKVGEFVLDKVEDTALKMIEEDRNPALTIFYLKCKGKKRGYVERQEVEHSLSPLLMDNFKKATDEETIENEEY